MKKNIKLLLLILFAMGGYIVSFDTIHHKVVSFNTAYAIDEENYDYDTIGRTNKPDASLKAEEPVIPQAVLDAISFIPGLNTAVSAITFVAKIGINLDVDFTGVSVNFMDVFISAIQILDPSSSANSESVAAVAIQQTFHSNLYCGFQRIYLEETSLISKNNPIGKGGGAYPMFPVYPLNIQVNENTGQCDLETGGVLSDSLKNVSGFVYTDETKCSFSYSATEKQCIYDYNMPYIITTNAAEIAAEVACFALSINAAKKAAAEKAEKESMEKSKKQMKEQVEKEMKKEIKEEMQEQIKEKIEKEIRKKLQDEAREAAAKAAKKAATSIAVKMSIKLAGRVLGDFADVFTDERYALDPVTLIGLIELGGLGGALFDFLVDVVTSPLTVGMSASCFAIKASTLTATAQILKTALLITTTIKYNDANNAIKKFTFCGHNWLSYARTGDRKYWERGMYAHSYYKTVSDCINSNNCSSTVGTVCVNPYNDSRFCSGINPTTKHIKNKVYREYVFGGMEYEVGFLEMDISSEDNRSEAITYKSEDCIDPRTPEQKGYDGVLQRYYMRGNERANYACGRFNHDGKSGCYLLASDVEEEDKNATGVKMVRGGSILSSYYLIPSNNVELANKYADRCRETFARARECCKHRGKHLACITNKTNGNFTFCLSNVLDTYSSELMPNLITALTFTNSDLHKGTCNLDDVEFEVGKKIGTNYACVYSKGLCPYNFKLNAGLNYKASYCDGDYFPDYKDPDSILRRGNSHLNVDDCKKGLFGAQYRAKYKEQFVSESVSAGAHTFYKVEQDMAGFNERDFNTIYDFDKILNKYYSGANTNPELVKKVFNCGGLTECRNNVSNIRDKGFVKNEENVITQYNLNAYMISNIKTSAYGKIKNFCQYRAHCVEVDKENEYSYLVIYTSSLFLDSSCGGKSNTSRHTLQIGSAIPKQLSAPIVECVTESLKNLINGVAGASLCKEGFEVNNE
ncbi:MAG: hypothetical protein LBS34_00365, partial [Rickettsiales bacterium]|nr:hypothetical protein [Rickettsiales bacterium]